MARPVLALVLAGSLSVPVGAHAHDASLQMAGAAKAFLAALDDAQQAKAVIAFDDPERRDWHFVPRARRGISLKELDEKQQRLAQALLASGLSEAGYARADGIMKLESVLAVIEGNPRLRDPKNYFLTFFGLPGRDPWGWRFEGHHLSLNFTLVENATPAVTPSFFGSHPAEVRRGPRRGTRVLAAEEDLGRALVKSLSEAQREKAIIMTTAPREIINLPGRNDTRPQGIAWSDLDAAQREALLSLIREYVYRVRTDVADDDMERLEAAGLDKLHFAWAGGLEPGEGHYYRVQGGTFVLELDNTQDHANHIHTLWRDFDRDFGEDLLAEHYRAAHAAEPPSEDSP